MDMLVKYDSGSQVDGASIGIYLPCGCTFSFRTPSRETLVHGLLLDPHPASKIWSDQSAERRLRQFHPKWIEIKLSRPFPAIKLFYLISVLTVISSLVVYFVQSFSILMVCLILLYVGMFYWLKGVLIESSLLVCSDFGIQTRHRFLTGHQSASSFVPMSRLQGLHLVEQLTPLTIRCYVAAELTQAGQSPDNMTGSPKISSLLHEGRFLLPLMPGCMTANRLNFINRLCVPFPTLVFVLRLVHAVCYGPSCQQNVDLENRTD
ncbi:hypothetical protein D915_009104 [Fasciola hepatica]|uniref:Uncharacterized protein n=1 Tax=Fasciola hepatica TaxID=6192 RepID=A0A4E0RGC5_FASHE|nr:hypothetical protein D915_009104 [Fasciola hepatica]